MKKARTSLFLVVALGLLALCPVGLADEFADKSVPLFCAVGWLGEFTHIDPSIGQVPPTRNDLPSTLQALACSPDGILYAGTGNRNGLYKIDPWTGNAEYFLPVNLDIAGMAFSPSGELYVTGASGARYLRTIDLTDGSSTSDRTLWGDRNSAQGLAFSPHGTLYAIRPNVFPGTYELLTIDLDDAQMHLLGSYSSTANVSQSIIFTADGRLYAIGRDAFAELNPTDGSLIGSHVTLSGDYRGLAILPPIVYYVDADATGNNDGSSWADAYNYLQDALAAAYSGDEIRVAQGIYKPDQGATVTPGDREATFQLISGVALKGGYAGFGEPDPNDRDVEGYETMLSGDLDGDDVEVVNPEDLLGEPARAENSKHVVTSSTADITTVFDGFSVIAANNNDNFGDYCDGGGMYNYNSSLIITNCTFSNNLAHDYGGGMHNHYGSPIISNCTFSNNFAYIGGGIQNWDSNSMLTNCILLGNSAGETGGGMENHSNSTLINCIFSGNSAKGGGGLSNYYGGNSTLINCIFSGNSSTSSVYYGGGGIHNSWGSNLTLTNCTFAINSSPNGNALSCDSFHQMYPGNVQISNSIFRDGGNEIWNNDNSTIIITYSSIQGGWSGEANIDADPCFVQPGYWDANGIWVDGDYHLLPGSPCIDAGDPNYVAEPNEMDLDGRPRVIGGRIDMGAYESPVPAEVRIVPRTINLTSQGKWITCYISLPEDYNVADIDPNSVLLEDEIEAESLKVDEQQQVAIVRFSRSEVQGILGTGEVELTITGQLTDGTVFEGTGVIRVIDKAGKK